MILIRRRIHPRSKGIADEMVVMASLWSSRSVLGGGYVLLLFAVQSPRRYYVGGAVGHIRTHVQAIDDAAAKNFPDLILLDRRN